MVVLSYLNYFAVVAAEVQKGLGNLNDVLAAFENDSDCLWKATTSMKMERHIRNAGLEVINNIRTDGLSFVLAEKVNAATDEAFGKWKEFICAHCEEPSILGNSMHGLLIGRKP